MTHSVRFRTRDVEIDYVVMTIVDSGHWQGYKSNLDVTDYKVEDGIWEVSFSNQKDCDGFSVLIDEEFLFKV